MADIQIKDSSCSGIGGRIIHSKQYEGGIQGSVSCTWVPYYTHPGVKITGELLTVFFGAAFLFVTVWVIGIATSPSPGALFEDFIDDVVSMYRWLKAYVGPLGVFCTLFESILGWSPVRSVLRWLNPREHTWNLPLLVGIVMGIVLLIGEELGQGGGSYQIGRLAIVAVVFLTLESAGVLLGYSLLAKPLGLFRQTPTTK